MKKLISKAFPGKSELPIEQNALAHFSAGRYKEAAELYKYLLKREDNSFHRQQLAQCYLQRAFSMSAKGMPKEAGVLWENYAEWTEPPLIGLDTYILWQLSAKNSQKAYARLAQLTAKQLDEEYPQLAVGLGFLLVTGVVELAAHLPADSALLAHWAVVQEALAAYQNKQNDVCELALQKLPFRSAFRDFRSLLKAQLISSSSVEQAQLMLAKIPVGSPYRCLANAVLATMQQGADFVQTALSLDNVLRRHVASAKGLSKSQLEMLETLQKQQDQASPKAQFASVLKHSSLLGNAAEAYCLGMLVEYPAGLKEYLKHFATKGSIEEYRIQALLSEQAGDIYQAADYWWLCIDLLERHRPANDKKIALILRHMAVKAQFRDAVDLLVDSLNYDSDDRDSYLKILNIYQQTQVSPAEYQSWLEKSLQRFPADIDFLGRAAKAAADKKSFKKAAGYAAKLLKIDPVNTLAKQLLFASHLSHARRLLKTKKFHLVTKEIQAAEQLMVDKNLRYQAELLRGFYIWLAEDKLQGMQQIVAAVQKLNQDPVNAQFQISMETALLEVPSASFIRALPASKEYLLSPQQLTRLMTLIKQYAEQVEDSSLICQALDKIKLSIKKSIQQQDFNEDLLLAWCQVLANIQHFELLKHCAKLAQAKWQQPIWMYFRVFAECNGDANNLDMMTVFKLQHAQDEARQNDDQKTALLIGRFLASTLDYQNPFNEDFQDDNFPLEEFSYDVFDELFAHVPEKQMSKIGMKVQDILLDADPEKFINDMVRQYGKKIDTKRLIKLFNNPAFMSAVACIKAAEQLHIDIGLSIEDIVYRFENDTPQISLPFF